MTAVYHVLNGDALKDQLPVDIGGDIYVARECLVEGSVAGDSFDEFIATRIDHLCENDDERVEYVANTKSQFEQIAGIPDGASVALWFEDDLFCQVNLWFVCSLIVKKDLEVSLVRPTGSNLRYGFGGLSPKGLVDAFEQRVVLSPEDIHNLSRLWVLYREHDLGGLTRLAESMKDSLPFVYPAVQAHCDRFQPDGSPGRPEMALQAIIRETEDADFGHIFREFSMRESIYGFGDTQVRNLYEAVKNRDLD